MGNLERLGSLIGKLAHKSHMPWRSYHDFIFPSAIDLPIQQKRMHVMQARIRMLAGILAIGLPAWGILEMFSFPHALWLSLFKVRILAGCILATFFLPWNKLYKRKLHNSWALYTQLGVLFLVPTLLYVYCIQYAGHVVTETSLAAAIRHSFYFFGFMILGGLGFFPLTILEASCLVLPFLVIYGLANGLPDLSHLSTQLSLIWDMGALALLSIMICANQLGVIIQIVSYSSYDALTKCLDRRSGEEVLQALWFYSRKNNSDLAIALVDLDRFKLVNDCFGHQVGDAVLSTTAITIRNAIRKSDFVIRWGGEEFLVLLPDSDIENAMKVFVRMARNGFCLRPDGSQQTISVGIVGRKNEEVDNEILAVKIADQRLYEAKMSGRSCVVGSGILILGESIAPVEKPPLEHQSAKEESGGAGREAEAIRSGQLLLRAASERGQHVSC